MTKDPNAKGAKCCFDFGSKCVLPSPLGHPWISEVEQLAQAGWACSLWSGNWNAGFRSDRTWVTQSLALWYQQAGHILGSCWPVWWFWANLKKVSHLSGCCPSYCSRLGKSTWWSCPGCLPRSRSICHLVTAWDNGVLFIPRGPVDLGLLLPMAPPDGFMYHGTSPLHEDFHLPFARPQPFRFLFGNWWGINTTLCKTYSQFHQCSRAKPTPALS